MARKARKSKGNTSQEVHDILGGKSQIFRVPQSGDVWQFKMWVTEEQKYFRKSLRTKDFDTAVVRAEEKYLQTYSDVASGRKIFGMSLGELVTEFINWRAEDVDAGNITKGRLVTIKSQCRHVLNFICNLAIYNFTVRSFDKTVLVDSGKGCQRVDQTNIWPFGRFNWTHTAVVRGVHIAYLKACTFAC